MKNRLIKGLLSAIFAIGACISLVFVFGVEVISGESGTKTKNLSLADWFELANENILQTYIWKVARIFMIIALAMIVVAAMFAIVRIFVDKKWIKTIEKVFAISGFVMTILFLITFVCGGLLYAASINTKTEHHLYFLHMGAALLSACGIASSCFAIPWKEKNQKTKEKK